MQGITQKVMAEPGKYSLQQLQQAVQSGSLPAYIGIPLIQEKLKQQKDMRGMEQAQAPQGPSIAEQVMQEAQGVEALPSNLPQQYAGGGIVAFEEGGEVERYQSTGLVQPQRRPDESFEAFRQRFIQETREQERMERERRFAADEAARQQTLAERGGTAIPPSPYGIQRQAFTPTGIAPAGAAAQPPVRIPDEGMGILGGVVDASGAARAALTGTRAPAAAGPDTGAPAKPAAGGPAKPGSAAGAPKITAPAGDSFSTIAERGISDYATSARNAEVEAEARKAAARSQIKGEAFDEYKKSLEEEAKQAGAERGQAKNIALFKAGLAMMAGTSRHALENIGKGALLGAEDYQAAVKDLKRAERERRKELSHIEQARRAEKIGDRDTAVREADAARDRSDAVSKYRAKALMDGAGLDKQQAMELVKTQFVADSNLFGKQVAGGYQLEAARIAAAARAAAGAGRGGFTENQLAKLRMDAMERVDQNQIRNQVAKQLGFSKVPKPGADAGFDAKVTTAYDQAVNTILRSAMGMSNVPGGGGNPYQGFRIVPEE